MSPDELKDWRKAAGLSQTELGSRIGLSLRQVQDIESGNTPLRTNHQLAIDMASMILANELRDGGKMTITALKVFTALEPCITPELRALAAFGVPPLTLTAHEQHLVDSWANAAGARPPEGQIRSFIENVRKVTEEARSGKR